MKQIPAKAVKEICAAQNELEACLKVKSNAFVHITRAIRHAQEAQAWIATSMLMEKYKADQKGAKR